MAKSQNGDRFTFVDIPEFPASEWLSLNVLISHRRGVLEYLCVTAVCIGPKLSTAHACLGKYTMRCNVLWRGGCDHVANAVLADTVLNQTYQCLAGDAPSPNPAQVGVFHLSLLLPAGMNNAAETNGTRFRLQLNGKHAVPALLVVSAGNRQPLIALTFCNGSAIAHPSHRLCVPVDRHQIR